MKETHDSPTLFPNRMNALNEGVAKHKANMILKKCTVPEGILTQNTQKYKISIYYPTGYLDGEIMG